LGSLIGVHSCFYRCPKKVAVTFGCTHLNPFRMLDTAMNSVLWGVFGVYFWKTKIDVAL
jgi:hypothetical protein